MMYWKNPFQEEEKVQEEKEKQGPCLIGIYHHGFSVNGHDGAVQVCDFGCAIRDCEWDLSESNQGKD